jgi:hypothetical protein
MTASPSTRTRRMAWLLGPLALVAALHCGTTNESTFEETACEGPYKGLCGKPCATDESCPSGLYCGAGARCTADCAPKVSCASGLFCDARGRCGGLPVNGGFPDGGDASSLEDVVCADMDVALTKTLPKVLFLLDQSSSMFFFKLPSGDSNGCSPDCRWSVLKDVLIGPTSNPGGLLKQLEGQAEMAVALYSATDPDPNDGDNSLLTGAVDNVCPRFNGKAFGGLTFDAKPFAAVDALLRTATVDDDTPTGPALRTVAGLGADGGVVDAKGFAALATEDPKVLVLVTDGEPGLCGENGGSTAGRAAVVSAVQQTFAQGIRTFVIAIGDVTPDVVQHFNAVANAGQGLDPATGNAGAIRPNTTQQLVAALEKVVLDARTCTFDLNGQVTPGTEKLGAVTLNGAPVPFDDPGAPDEGWRLVSPSRVELVGSACATLKSTPDAQLSARFPCGAITPIPK